MKEKKRVPLGYIWLIFSLLVIGVGVFVFTYQNMRVLGRFRPQTYEMEEPSFRANGLFRSYLEFIGADLSVPGTEGQTLTFTAPTSFSYFKYGMEEQVKKGDTISCDFVSWSGNKRNERFLRMEIDGKTVETYVSLGTARKLYMAALEQNGLEEQFLQDTGESLSRSSAREALRTIDKQIYDMGVYTPMDYPFDRCMFRTMVLLTSGSAIVVFLLLLTVVPQWIEYCRYQLWLREYNRENSQRWQQVAGHLPQFVSLQENADGGKPQPVYQAPGFVERIQKLFSPVAKK